MTTSLSSKTFPDNPAPPATVPLGYVTPTSLAPPTSEPPLTAAEIATRRDDFYELMFQKFLVTVTGLFIPGISTYGQLQDWANSLGLGDLLALLTGIPNATNHDAATWGNNLLGHHSAMPEIQAASVVDTNPNLILAPVFPTPVTVVGDVDHGWSWDTALGHDSVGCVKIDAIGVLDELLSNEIRVAEGQKVYLSVWVKWSAITYTGTDPIVMGVTRYLNKSEVGSDDLASFTSPAGTQDWTELSKSAYEVPPGCDEIRLRFKIAANLTTGTVFWDDASVTKNQPGSGYVGTFLDTMVQGLENVNQPGWDLNDLLISMLNQFRTTADHAKRIALLEGVNTTGNKINDEFLRVGGTLGGNWNQTYIGGGAGTWETDGNYAVWRKSGFGTLDVRCRWIGTVPTTATDNQKIIAVIGSKGEVGFLPTLIELIFICESHVDLYGRMDTLETSWIRARFSASGDVFIHSSVAGVVTELGHTENWNLLFRPGGNQPPSAGSTIALVCGTPDGARFFEAQIDGRVVCSGNDLTSNLGASYRGYGHGARAEGSILALGQAAPSALNAWAAVDN